MQHIDRKSLYTNLEARIRYLHSFLDFGASQFLLFDTLIHRPNFTNTTNLQPTSKPSAPGPSTSKR